MNNLKLLVLGASGNTGRRLVEMALARGHQVTAIVRATAILPDRDGLRVVIGDVLDPTILKEASYSVDAIVSCLGIRKENPSDPWSRLISPEDFTERSAQLASDAMKLNGIKRLVAISSAGIGDSWSSVDPELQHVIETSNVGKIFEDLNKMEEALTKSGLDTLALRPVAVVDGEVSGRAGLVERFDKGSKIMTGDIAKWILDAVERPEAFRSRHEMIGTVSPDPAAL